MFKTLYITLINREINFGFLYTNCVILKLSIISTGNFDINIPPI